MHTPQRITILTLLAGGVCFAQDSGAEPDPAPAAELAGEHADEHGQKIRIIEPGNLPRMGTNKDPIQPTKPNISTPHTTGLTEGQDWMKVVNNSIDEVARPSALAEGSFLISRTGRLVPAPNDRLIFVPSPEERLPGEGPTLLLPCATLERLENIWANQPVTVSGEIMSYHDRNYLLISDFALGIVQMPVNDQPAVPAVAPAEVPAASTTPDDAQPAEIPSGLDEDPDLMDLLRELDAENLGSQDAFDDSYHDLPVSTRSPDQDSSSQLQVAAPSLAPGVREGALMIRRPARLDRAADGSWMAIFDNDDPDVPEGIELTVLPCSLLMTMENQSIRFGDSARFMVSGRIYIHNSRGYLLPTFYQRLRTSDIKPWQ